jgi:IS4 transposase
VNVPADCTPVVWRLVTTDVIESTDDIDRVIEIYRKRWVIEEFFKAIKTGCRFESHQLEHIKGLLIALSIESAIAWQL